jgi:Zn-dependent peptidase ImmA (M78 family)
MSNISREEVEDIAEAFSKNWRTFIEFFIKKLNGRIEYFNLTDKIDEEKSVIVNSENDWVIKISSHLGYERTRFTLSHNIGHFIIHSDYGRIPCAFPMFADNITEAQANWFAQSFLMPKNLVLAAYEECNYKYKNFDDILKVCAVKFSVQEKQMSYRLERLGLNA